MVSQFNRLERIEFLSKEFLSSAKPRLAKFRASLDNDPHYAFSWGSDAIKAAALHDVGTTLRGYITKVRENHSDWTDDQVADCIVVELEAELLRKARWPDSSTSEISNVISRERNAALAEFVSRMKGL